MYYLFINVIFLFACVIGEVTHAHTMCKNPCACRHVHVFCACFIEGGDGPNRTGQDFEIFISIFLVNGLLCDLGIGCISSISLFVIIRMFY